MFRLFPALAALALIAGPAAAETAAKPATPKPAAAKAAPAKPATPAPAKPAAPKAPPFSAQDPASLVAMLEGMQAKSTVTKTEAGEVFLKVSTPTFSFSTQFVGCNATGRNCAAMAFSTLTDKKTATIAQLNAFNQTSITCRVFQDQQGKPHVMYSTLLSPNLQREDLRIHVGVWQGCLASFGEFLRDPPGYLAAAP